jgi:hypothetical protein
MQAAQNELIAKIAFWRTQLIDVRTRIKVGLGETEILQKQCDAILETISELESLLQSLHPAPAQAPILAPAPVVLAPEPAAAAAVAAVVAAEEPGAVNAKSAAKPNSKRPAAHDQPRSGMHSLFIHLLIYHCFIFKLVSFCISFIICLSPPTISRKLLYSASMKSKPNAAGGHLVHDVLIAGAPAIPPPPHKLCTENHPPKAKCPLSHVVR